MDRDARGSSCAGGFDQRKRLPTFIPMTGSTVRPEVRELSCVREVVNAD